ncbi:Hypothetical protein SRAE_X000071000 [Strongyloides ratti]|uniref:Uncharacterized protein n=1 Tax=Strongyloides ratti TaxID=34506 RepID=A0A090N0W2_STRRB|nr:Hypothetical protein SRAE_X000071000 [Strongyloides ratti]CEF71383.1 Hypothetical protein SRAE_X000071000 [Strongyloides ratti]
MNHHPSSTDLLVEVERLRQSEANLSAQIRKMTEEHNYDNKRLKDKINSLLNCVNEGKLLQEQVTYLQNSILTAEKEKNEALLKMESAISMSTKQDTELKNLQEKYSSLLETKTELENQLKVWIDKCCSISMESSSTKEINDKKKVISNGDVNINDLKVKLDYEKQKVVELENELKRKNADIAYKEQRISQILGHIDLLEGEKRTFMIEKERFTRNVKLEELENLQSLVNEKTTQCNQLTNAFYELQEQYKIFDTKYRELGAINQKYKETIQNQYIEINQQFNKITEYNNKVKELEDKIKEKNKEIEEINNTFKIFQDIKTLPNAYNLLDEIEDKINKLSQLLGVRENENELEKEFENNNISNGEENIITTNGNSNEIPSEFQNTPKTIVEMIRNNKTGKINKNTINEIPSDDQKSKVLKLEKEVENLLEKLLESENKNISLEKSLEKIRTSTNIYEEIYNDSLEANEAKQIYDINSSQINNYEEIKKPSHIPSYIWEKINLDKNLCLFLKHQQEKLEHLETENDSMHEVYQLFFRKLRDDLQTKIDNGKKIGGDDIIAEILQNNIVSKTNSSEKDDSLLQKEDQQNEKINSINDSYLGTGKIIEL